jgi:hypothetical protein
MNCGMFHNTGFLEGPPDGGLDQFVADMVASYRVASGVHREFTGWKYILPCPFFACIGILPVKSSGEIDFTIPCCQVFFMEFLYPFEMET